MTDTDHDVTEADFRLASHYIISDEPDYYEAAVERIGTVRTNLMLDAFREDKNLEDVGRKSLQFLMDEPAYTSAAYRLLELCLFSERFSTEDRQLIARAIEMVPGDPRLLVESPA
jgi:hypothetical protein